MSHNNVINEKRKALLAYKEKILDEIKCYERSINDFHTNLKNNSLDEQVDSSDSEDDFPCPMDWGPSVSELKLQQAMMKTCLQATQELTSLTVLQSEVNVMVEEPKLEEERPVTEDGSWQEVTAECRIDLVPFTINFFMHTPTRKFAPPSYRGLRVVPVKSAHELELSKSVLHAVKVPSDAIEVLKSYAAGYRSRRTTLARLANKYPNSLFMEPHVEGGFVLKCADLLEVSWRLENKWSPVAPFHHRMKFDLEYMDESNIKIITQAHKQLLDPAIQTDERTLLLAKIISTCLEARGPIDPESDLESKTTERDTDMEKRDSETEKLDSEVMAPPKSLPKKVKQKNKNSLPNPAQKRSMNNDDGDNTVKKMRNSDLPSFGPRNSGDSNRKHAINDLVNEGAKKRKINEDEAKKKVASNKNIKETGNTENNTDDIQPKNVKDTDIKVTNTKNKNNRESVKTKTKNLKETDAIENKDVNTKPENGVESGNKNEKPVNIQPKNYKETLKTKTKNVKDPDDIESTNANNKPKDANKNKQPVNAKTKNVKESGDIADKNVKTKVKHVTKTVNNDDKDSNTKSKNKNTKRTGNTEKNMKEGNNAKDQNDVKDDNIELNKANNVQKTKIVKEASNIGKITNSQPKKSIVKEGDNSEKNANTKNIDKKITKKVPNVKSKENIDANRITGKVSTNDADRKTKDVEKNINVAKTKNVEANINKPKPKENNVAKPKNDQGVLKQAEKNIKGKEKLPTNLAKIIKEKTSVNSNTVKKVIEKHANNKIKDKISPIINKVINKDVKDAQNMKEIAPDVVISHNVAANVNKENLINKKVSKEPIKNITHKIASHRTALKVQNPQKSLKPGNTKIFSSGNTEKENGGKVSKIPQKKLSPISEGSSKKNLLRISPRKLPSKFKSPQMNTFKQVIIKSTNIPRLLKKPAPKTTR